MYVSCHYCISSNSASHCNPVSTATPSVLHVAVGVSAAVALMVGVAVGFALGMLSGWSIRGRRKGISNTQSQPPSPPPPSTSDSPQLPLPVPEYEDIIPHATMNMHLQGNAAYGCRQ